MTPSISLRGPFIWVRILVILLTAKRLIPVCRSTLAFLTNSTHLHHFVFLLMSNKLLLISTNCLKPQPFLSFRLTTLEF